MRHLIWIAVLVAFTQTIPVAFAQSDSGGKGGAYTAGTGGAPPPSYTPDKLNPQNCGTPDEPKFCTLAPKARKMAKKKQTKS
jgi:hypothetical protein